MEPVVARPVVGARPQARPGARAIWGFVAAVCAAVLGVARYLPPDERGFGTHQQLGMPPCSFVLTTGLPCPTCGMTTAFSMIMHGRPWAGVMAQPAGALLCVAAVGLLGFSVYAAVTGRIVSINWERVGPVRIALGTTLLFMLAWGFKLAHGLLTGALPVR